MVKWKILVHGDSDGVCSGALAYHYFTSKGYDVEVYFTHPAGLVSDLEEFVKPGDNVFIADIALSEPHLEDITKWFSVLSRQGNLIYIDHHPEPLSFKPSELDGIIIHDTCCSASELTFKYFYEQGIDPDYSRVGLYGAVGDYLDETPWVKKILMEWDKRSVYYEAGVLVQGLEGSRRMYDFKRRVIRLLAENKLPSSSSELLLRALVESQQNEELRIWVKNNHEVLGDIAYVINPPGSLGRAANYSRVYSRKRIGIAFERRNNIWILSARAVPPINLNIVLRKVALRMNGTGGGHPLAAGARIPYNKFREFLEILNEEVKKLWSTT